MAHNKAGADHEGLTLNGNPHPLQPGQTLAELLATLSLGNQAVAVAVDRCVIPRQRWQAHILAPGQSVEIVRAIGGG